MPNSQKKRINKLNQQIEGLRSRDAPTLAWTARKPATGKQLYIFSGSFNPISTAHIELINTALQSIDGADVLLLLAMANVDKEVFGLSLAERLLTLEHYVATQKTWSVAACSHGRFIDKLMAIKKTAHDYDSFTFIVGYDTLIRIFEPRYYQDFSRELDELFSQCRFIAATRQDYDLDAMQTFMSSDAVMPYAPKVDLIALPAEYLEVSSTNIRMRLANRQNVTGLIPQTVHDLVIELTSSD
ncbi:MAG: nicotinate-nicotinamide nucleotide adenylyltransferase [Pseudomonadota bacterium]